MKHCLIPCWSSSSTSLSAERECGSSCVLGRSWRVKKDWLLLQQFGDDCKATDAIKDTVPWVITLSELRRCFFSDVHLASDITPALLYQPVGGDVLCRLGQRALKHRAPSIYFHNWWWPPTCPQPKNCQEDALTQKAAVKYLRNS